VLADNSELSATLSRMPGIDLTRKVETLLMGGNGTTEPLGLATAATPFVHSAVEAVDRVSEAWAAAWKLGLMCDRLIVSPDTYHRWRTERTTTERKYVGPNWVSGSAGVRTVWDIPMVLSADISDEVALLCDSRFIEILDRQAPQIMVSSEDRDNFVKNLVTILCEERFGTAIYRDDVVFEIDVAGT
jgi:HK97 family phage major capsid protein